MEDKPLIDSTVGSEGASLDDTVANLVVSANFVIPNFECDVVSKIVNLEVVCLVPVWVLSTIVVDLGLPLLFSEVELNIGIHLAESLGAVGDVSINCNNVQNSFVDS